MIERFTTRKVNIGGVFVGGDAPIAVQSMNNTDTRDVEATLAQITELKNAGCDITRVAILNMEAAQALSALGYSASDALRAVRKVKVTAEMTAEEVLKMALRVLL